MSEGVLQEAKREAELFGAAFWKRLEEGHRRIAAGLLVACSSSGGGGPTDFYTMCAQSTPGHVDVSLNELEDAVLGPDAGVDAGRGNFDAGESPGGNACYTLCPASGVTTGFCSI